MNLSARPLLLIAVMACLYTLGSSAIAQQSEQPPPAEAADAPESLELEADTAAEPAADEADTAEEPGRGRHDHGDVKLNFPEMREEYGSERIECVARYSKYRRFSVTTRIR